VKDQELVWTFSIRENSAAAAAVATAAASCRNPNRSRLAGSLITVPRNLFGRITQEVYPSTPYCMEQSPS